MKNLLSPLKRIIFFSFILLTVFAGEEGSGCKCEDESNSSSSHSSQGGSSGGGKSGSSTSSHGGNGGNKGLSTGQKVVGGNGSPNPNIINSQVGSLTGGGNSSKTPSTSSASTTPPEQTINSPSPFLVRQTSTPPSLFSFPSLAVVSPPS